MSRPGDTEARRRTKLICTIGPATARRIETLAAAGMDVARINFSHGTPASHAAAALAVRRAAAAGHRPLAILIDLAGPKIRLGDLAGGSVDLVAGRPFVLRGSSARGAARRRVRRRTFRTGGWPPTSEIGDPIFLADGAAELRVTGLDDGVRTEVVRGGSDPFPGRRGHPGCPAVITGAHGQGPVRHSAGDRYRRQLRRPVVRPQRRRRRRASPAARDGWSGDRRQDRDTPGGRVVRRHPRRRRRGDDRPRRPWRRDAIRGGAPDPEAARPAGSRPRRAVDRRHPDARVDDGRSATDAGRGQRRRQCRLRWGGRDHAQRRDGDRRLSGAGCRGRCADRLAVRDPGRSLSARRDVTTSGDGRRGARLCRGRADVGAYRDRGDRLLHAHWAYGPDPVVAPAARTGHRLLAGPGGRHRGCRSSTASSRARAPRSTSRIGSDSWVGCSARRSSSPMGRRSSSSARRPRRALRRTFSGCIE